MLDVGGYRAGLRVELTELGRDAAEGVETSGTPRRLDAMTPFERKVVHDAVAAAGLRSESEGEEPNRRVVVFPVGSSRHAPRTGPPARPSRPPGEVPHPGEVPPPPPEAAEVFGTALPLAERYVGMLAGPGVTRGLLGPREVPRLWSRHVLNCAAVADLVPRPATLIDLGSGAGLPGIVLALLLPDVQVTLLERMERRTIFLWTSASGNWACARAGLPGYGGGPAGSWRRTW